jgi:hypothetical protein
MGDVMSWQPIETAPMAKPVICCFEGGGVYIAHYSRAIEQWVSEYGHYLNEPTHWMPLPKLPQSSQGATNEQ